MGGIGLRFPIEVWFLPHHRCLTCYVELALDVFKDYMHLDIDPTVERIENRTSSVFLGIYVIFFIQLRWGNFGSFFNT